MRILIGVFLVMGAIGCGDDYNPSFFDGRRPDGGPTCAPRCGAPASVATCSGTCPAGALPRGPDGDVCECFYFPMAEPTEWYWECGSFTSPGYTAPPAVSCN